MKTASFLLLLAAAVFSGCSSNRPNDDQAVESAVIEPLSPRLRQAALRHLSGSRTSKEVGSVDLYLKGYRDGIQAQLLSRGNSLLINYAGEKSWGRGYEQGVVDARWSKEDFSLLDVGYEKYFEGLGELQFGFEKASFSPESAEERWWIDEASPQDSLKGCRKKCFVQGWITRRGKYGHLGMYQRAIVITSVVREEMPEGTGKP